MSGFGDIRSFRNREEAEEAKHSMTERELVDQEIRTFMDGLWQRGDPWDIESSEYERERHAHLLGMLGGKHYAQVSWRSAAAPAF